MKLELQRLTLQLSRRTRSARIACWAAGERSKGQTMSKQQLSAAEKAKIDQGVQFGMNMLKLVPADDPLAREAHITGVLVAFMGAMWGTLGTEYARVFLEAQLRSMEQDVPHERFMAPRVQ